MTNQQDLTSNLLDLSENDPKTLGNFQLGPLRFKAIEDGI